jgi:hypothetical protein
VHTLHQVSSSHTDSVKSSSLFKFFGLDNDTDSSNTDVKSSEPQNDSTQVTTTNDVSSSEGKSDQQSGQLHFTTRLAHGSQDHTVGGFSSAKGLYVGALACRCCRCFDDCGGSEW